MMTKEEYVYNPFFKFKDLKKDYVTLINCSVDNPISKKGLLRLVDEHLELENKYFNLYDRHFAPKPYKFEDLKPNMWVWDDRLKACFLIKAIKPNTHWNIVIYANYLTDTFEELEFEEGRFYPVIKAMGGI